MIGKIRELEGIWKLPLIILYIVQLTSKLKAPAKLDPALGKDNVIVKKTP